MTRILHTCGYAYHPQDTYCLQCGELLPDSTRPIAIPPGTLPEDPPLTRRGTDFFQAGANAILHIWGYDQQVSVSLESPLILGRSGIRGSDETLDLDDFNAYQHGVSRWHCRLQRYGSQLIVTDLGSCNGTYLNNRRLRAHRDYVVTHGTYLSLGTLTLVVLFSSEIGS